VIQWAISVANYLKIIGATRRDRTGDLLITNLTIEPYSIEFSL
jgi:hypothetical protein